jgi:uncharacterized protein YutD
MKKHVIIEYDIEYCNRGCPHFYFKFEDGDNCWCDKLNKRMYNSDDVSWDDRKTRPIPDDCPLEDVGEQKDQFHIRDNK